MTGEALRAAVADVLLVALAGAMWALAAGDDDRVQVALDVVRARLDR